MATEIFTLAFSSSQTVSVLQLLWFVMSWGSPSFPKDTSQILWTSSQSFAASELILIWLLTCSEGKSSALSNIPLLCVTWSWLRLSSSWSIKWNMECPLPAETLPPLESDFFSFLSDSHLSLIWLPVSAAFSISLQIYQQTSYVSTMFRALSWMPRLWRVETHFLFSGSPVEGVGT